MLKTSYLNRSATVAIAATLSLLSTPTVAQDAPADLPVAESTTVAPEPAAPVASEPAPVPVVEAPAEPATTATTATPEPKAKPLRARASVAPNASRPVPAAPEPATPEMTAPAEAATPTPAEALAAAIPEPTADTIEPTAVVEDDTVEMLTFGGILALLVVGGGVTALMRRRRKPVAKSIAAPHHAPVFTPVATDHADRSAFAWGQRDPAPARVAAPAAGSWIERARRGPTPDNPSLSLKKRLKRAAFFERREREVAAGKAVAVPAAAGLPERIVGSARDVARRPVFTPAFQSA